MAYKTIKIYGAETETGVSGEQFPTIIDVEAIPGVISQEYEVQTVEGGIDDEGTEFEFLDGSALKVSRFRYTFAPEGLFKRISTTTDIDTLFGLSVLESIYNWVYVDDYQPRPSAMTSTKVMACNIDFDIVTTGNAKAINFEISSRYTRL